MAWRRSVLTFASVVLLVVAVAAVEVERVNNSAAAAAASLWSGAADDDESLNDHAELDGGFPTLDGMLQWAIGHSDPAKLEMKANDARHLSTDELLKRQLEIKELVEKLEMPSDAKLMQIAIDDLNNSSLNLEDHRRALEELLILVEAIDNANNLHKMGGLSLVIEGFSNSDSVIRKTCAWIVGKACQNNPVVQNQVLELGALRKLMMMVKSSDVEEDIKALYAVSAVIRNNQNGLHTFYTQGGDLMLQGILGNATADVRLQKRSVSLVADLAEYQLEEQQQQVPSFLNGCGLVRLLIGLTTSTDDLDLQEKVLLAVKNLLMLKSTQEVVDGFCGLKGALERMMQQLQNLNSDYSVDVQRLCNEVNIIYLEKLNKVSQLPT